MKERIFSILAALLMSIGLLAVAIYVPATSERIMLPLMEHFAPPQDTGLPAGEYPAVVDMITDYLRNRTDDFQHVFIVNGTEYAAFNAKEQHHMADVQDLFRLCQFVAWLGWGMALLGGLAVRRDSDWRIVRRTLIAILAMVTVIIIAACIDFNSLFILFHKVAFSNDLWLLDPRTDLLIRLMPIGFFISYASIIGGIWLLGMIGMLAISTIRIKKMQDKGE